MTDRHLVGTLLLLGALALGGCQTTGPARQEDPAVRLEVTFAS